MLYLRVLILFVPVTVFKAKQLVNNAHGTTAKGYKRAPDANKDAFDKNFDTCMINQWTTPGPGLPVVLRTSPTAACSTTKHSRLCYGLPARRPNNAQYISCYNTEKLIPEFTAYVVPPLVGPPLTGYKRPNAGFRQDEGPLAPNPQAQHTDCNKPPGAVGQYFCSRGHLVPNGAFDTKDERDLTFTMTNIAPQWQEFNAGNWNAVEQAVKAYVNNVGHGVYVFTGTAGMAKYWSTKWLFIPWREPYRTGTGNMVVPKFYWKAVCDPDPAVRQSIVFIAENNVDVTSSTKVTTGTCTGQPMTQEKGVVYCYSVSAAQNQYFQNWWHGFTLPDFDPTNCRTGNMGNFLNTLLKFS
ncbi:uncharacterized protein LOC114515638 [Dendronephthya gigantea]|uniref:uncharacterized protein LOC114515638 n=1 Tax=Dendronephthya gigantea TaxID=151771 RepID=UPI00106C5C9C|nr:uncharacterized protein LOC114515638 [Dendronephthya gigantea]XP_028390732.1 uncharacterized protein LOC114515638 [Dendronephthya gigantea]